MLKSKSRMSTPTEVIQATASRLHGTPAFIVGSCVAAEQYGKNTFNDLDVFVPTQELLFVVIQKLLDDAVTKKHYDTTGKQLPDMLTVAKSWGAHVVVVGWGNTDRWLIRAILEVASRLRLALYFGEHHTTTNPSLS